jgi:hypothetical protein
LPLCASKPLSSSAEPSPQNAWARLRSAAISQAPSRSIGPMPSDGAPTPKKHYPKRQEENRLRQMQRRHVFIASSLIFKIYGLHIQTLRISWQILNLEYDLFPKFISCFPRVLLCHVITPLLTPYIINYAIKSGESYGESSNMHNTYIQTGKPQETRFMSAHQRPWRSMPTWFLNAICGWSYKSAIHKNRSWFQNEVMQLLSNHFRHYMIVLRLSWYTNWCDNVQAL